MLALTALFLLGLFATEMADPDSWFHLKTGEYMMRQHRLPYPDPFAWTTPPPTDITQYFNLTHEWLAQVWMYLLYAAGGFAAIILWKALALAATCAIVGFIAMRRTDSLTAGVLAALGSAWLVSVFNSDRPTIFTFLFIAVYLAIFEVRQRLWLLPAIAIVWANCHGGFFLGWLICGAYSVAAWRDADRKQVWLWSGAALAASLVNPNGWRVIETLLLYRQSAMQATLIEWSKPYLWGPPYAFDILLYAAAAVLLYRARQVRLSDWLLFALFAAAALSAFRNIILIGILAPVLIAAYFPWRRAVPVAAIYALMAALAAGTLYGTVRGRFFQFHAAEWRFPVGAARFLAQHNIPGPLFNTYEHGGYLMWAGQKVFIDGRALSETVFQEYREILGGKAEGLEKRKVRTVVLNSFEFVSGVMYPLVIALYNQPDWQLVYADAQAMVLMKDTPPGVRVLAKQLMMDHIDLECSAHIEKDPEYPLCARTLGDFYLRNNSKERAKKALALYLASDPDADASAKQAYQGLIGH